MKFSSAFAALAAASLASADEWVACRVNGVQISVVSKDTGECAFPIASSLPVNFKYGSPNNYLVDSYYIEACGERYFNEPIDQAQRSIMVPARCLFNSTPIDMFHINLIEPPSNTTDSLRKRFDSQFSKRAVQGGIAGLIQLVKRTRGTPLKQRQVVAVNTPDPGTAPNTPPNPPPKTLTRTITQISTSLITVTNCDSTLCQTNVVPQTPRTVTQTVLGSVQTVVQWYTMDYTPRTETITITDCGVQTCTEIVTVCVIPVCTTTVTICQDNTCHTVAVPTTQSSALPTGKAAPNAYSYSSTSTAAPTAAPGGRAAPDTYGYSSSTALPSGRAAPDINGYSSSTAAPTAAPGGRAAPDSYGYSSASTSVPTAAVPSVYKGAGAVAKGSVLAILALPLAYIL